MAGDGGRGGERDEEGLILIKKKKKKKLNGEEKGWTERRGKVRIQCQKIQRIVFPIKLEYGQNTMCVKNSFG